jgi:predicted nucleic acid-binding protein
VIAYVDSSVVLRVVLGQRDRLAEWRQIRTGVASALCEVECLRTLDRLRLAGGLTDKDLARRRELVYAITGEMELVDISRPVLGRASQPFPTPLGTLDAVHLATALLWREREAPALVMATHDAALGTAARALGFGVIGT